MPAVITPTPFEKMIPHPLTLDLDSGRVTYNAKSVSLSDTRRRLLVVFSKLAPGEIVTENQLKLDVWKTDETVKTDTCGVSVRALGRLIETMGCPDILEREYGLGWRRTGVPIVVLNAPSEFAAPPKPVGVDLLIAHAARLRAQYPWIMQTVLHKWKHARARAKEGRWTSQSLVDLFEVLTRMKSLRIGQELPAGSDGYTVCVRAEDRFAWVYKALCANVRFAASKDYVPLTDMVVMNYESWMCFGYDTILAMASNELRQRGRRAASGKVVYQDDDPEAQYPESVVELHHIATTWYPAIDPYIPFGKALVRSP